MEIYATQKAQDRYNELNNPKKQPIFHVVYLVQLKNGSFVRSPLMVSAGCTPDQILKIDKEESVLKKVKLKPDNGHKIVAVLFLDYVSDSFHYTQE